MSSVSVVARSSFSVADTVNRRITSNVAGTVTIVDPLVYPDGFRLWSLWGQAQTPGSVLEFRLGTSAAAGRVIGRQLYGDPGFMALSGYIDIAVGDGLWCEVITPDVIICASWVPL